MFDVGRGLRTEHGGFPLSAFDDHLQDAMLDVGIGLLKAAQFRLTQASVQGERADSQVPGSFGSEWVEGCEKLQGRFWGERALRFSHDPFQFSAQAWMSLAIAPGQEGSTGGQGDTLAAV